MSCAASTRAAIPDSAVVPGRRAAARGGRRAAFVLATALGLAVAAAAPAATVYKWVDANGRIVYSDQPPPGNVKTEVVKPPPPPANPDAAQELEDRTQADKDRDKKRREDAKAADKARATTEQRREICVNALAQIRTLQQKSEVVYRYNEKGEKVVFDDEMRRAALEQQQQIARENCPG